MELLLRKEGYGGKEAIAIGLLWGSAADARVILVGSPGSGRPLRGDLRAQG